MARNFKFYKFNNKWFIDLPEWEGSISDLEMVMGADTFLDILAQGDDTVYATLSDVEIPDSDKLIFESLGDPYQWSEGGANYKLESYKGHNYGLEVWLCDVTKFVFGDFPKIIYFK